MNSKTRKILAVLTLTAVTAFGAVGSGSAATSKAPSQGDHGTVIAKIGDPWCC